MNGITSELEIKRTMGIIDPSSHRILNILQKPIVVNGKLPFFRNIISKLHLIYIGGSVEMIGVKKNMHKGKIGNRNMIPIDIRASNAQQIEFYRKELIPEVLKVFLETHEKYKDVVRDSAENK